MYLYDNKVVFFCLLVQVIICTAGIIIQKIGYYRLINISENIHNVRDIKLKNISNKRENVYNVDNYVDKYVNSFKFCGLKLYTISEICGYLLNFLFITWGNVCIYGVYREVDIKEILWTVMLGILVVGGLFNIGATVDNSRFERVAKINIKDYIENVIQTNIRKEEIVSARKEKVRKREDIVDKPIIDFEYNNVGVVPMEKNKDINTESRVIANNTYEDKDGMKRDNLGYLSEYMSTDKKVINKDTTMENVEIKFKDDEEQIIEGFLRQYFA